MPDTIPLWTDDETMNLADFDENAQEELIAQGTYNAYCDEATFGESKTSGEPMVTLRFEVRDSENAAYNGRKMFFHCVIGGEHKEFGIKNLKKAGVALNPEINWSAFKPADVQEYFEGKDCRLKIKIGKDKRNPGAKRNNVDEVLPAGEKSFW
jgi:hypothetical protein